MWSSPRMRPASRDAILRVLRHCGRRCRGFRRAAMGLPSAPALRTLPAQPEETPMSDDAALFDKGLPIRRSVLGSDYVDRSLGSADDFMMGIQRAATAW